MDTRLPGFGLLRKESRILAAGAVFFVFSVSLGVLQTGGQHEEALRSRQKLLQEILSEVVEIGPRKGEDFLKREFWFDLDGDVENKEEHVVFLRYSDGHRLRMILQVTFFTTDRGHRFLRYARESKTISCAVREKTVELERSDFAPEELDRLLPAILQGIKKEKTLLEKIRK